MVKLLLWNSHKNLHYLNLKLISGLSFYFTELKIKQEEETAEEADNRSPALEETSQTGEEGVSLEESMSVSPSNVQDGLSDPNLAADAGSQQPHGNEQYIRSCLVRLWALTIHTAFF